MENLLDEVLENTRQRAISLVQRHINKACDGKPMSVGDLAKNIVTDDFIKRFRELFADDINRSKT